LPIHSAQIDILDLRVETRGKRWGAWALHRFFWSGLDVDGDVGKKKAVRRGKTFEGKKAAEKNEAVEKTVAKETARATTETEKKKGPVRCIHRHTDVEFRREFRQVCEKLIEKSKAGGIQETRLLLQIGKFGDPKVAKRRGVKSLSEMLMDELKRRQDEREAATDEAKAEAQSTEANEASGEGATSGGDADNG
jgi:hypothetical protein